MTIEELVTSIEALLEGRTNRSDEAAIIELLRSAEDTELDAALVRLDLARVIGDVDNRLFGPDHSTALLDLLTRERVGVLSIEARAGLVAALQRGRTSSRDEAAISNILLATTGSSLTALKNAIDAGHDHRDLQQLIFCDIDDDDMRDALLTHFAEQARSVEQHEVKVLSDIDDTFYANWKDERFPKKTIYPGVRQLYVELDRGPTEAGRMGDLAFVTARPKDRPGLVECATHESLGERGIGCAVVLAGSFFYLLSNDSIAEKKLANFVDYARLFPEYEFVFIGDSGQGDIVFGRQMREREPERVRAVFIHDVVATPDPDRLARRQEGIILFDTYVGAACEALELGLISVHGLERILTTAQEELALVPFCDDHQRTARLADLARDETRARHLILCS
ncbi:MAG TPA: phosphatase domain-containing protein [Polyangiaceae bacterium]|nr:phosphatase domain-containing protein [Polyangiaceae bacterium]